MTSDSIIWLVCKSRQRPREFINEMPLDRPVFVLWSWPDQQRAAEDATSLNDGASEGDFYFVMGCCLRKERGDGTLMEFLERFTNAHS